MWPLKRTLNEQDKDSKKTINTKEIANIRIYCSKDKEQQEFGGIRLRIHKKYQHNVETVEYIKPKEHRQETGRQKDSNVLLLDFVYSTIRVKKYGNRLS